MKANPTGPYEGGLREVAFERRRTTGPDGRFRLDGVGRERVVMFTVAGPTIALTRTFAMTKDVPPVRSSNTYIVGPRTMIFHGARFDFAVEPMQARPRNRPRSRHWPRRWRGSASMAGPTTKERDPIITKSRRSPTNRAVTV